MSASGVVITSIRPVRGFARVGIAELWAYRDLLYFMVWRDIKIRYKQTLLGMAWAVIQPVTTMVIFSVIFGGLARLPSDGLPYPVFAYVALLPWGLFAAALTRATGSVVGNAQLITKVYFPRLLIPLASLGGGLVDFAIAFVVLLGLLAFYGILPPPTALLLPLLVLQTLATSLAIGIWLAALNVRFRDISHAVPFLVQIWLYLSPVAYSTTLIPEQWRLVYALNPMVGVVEGFRWALLGTTWEPGPAIVVSGGVVALLLISGLLYFRRVERTFADVI